MSDSVVRTDPRDISTSLKEAVVDALVNKTFCSISGHGPDGNVLYGARPRALLNSAFLLPRPEATGDGDEVTQPIRIYAHGLDFCVRAQSSETIEVKPSLQVYVRVLPNEEDLKRPAFAPSFRLNDETRKALTERVKEALDAKWKELDDGTGKKRHQHPDWKALEAKTRREVQAAT